MCQFRLPAFLILLALGTAAQAVEEAQIPVMCGDKRELAEMLREYDERAVMVMNSTRMIRNQVTSVPTVLFVNHKTTTWTLVEHVAENTYCVVAMGDNIQPYDSRVKSVQSR